MFLLPLKIHKADLQDQTWVNEQYQQVDFRPSDLNVDIVAIASWENEPAGLGRLQPIAEHIWELGGMYVFEAFRKKGIAGRLVQGLLQQVPEETTVYCLPFEHLSDFYKQYGFEEVSIEELENIPTGIQEKLDWCNATYPDPVLLLSLKKN